MKRASDTEIYPEPDHKVDWKYIRNLTRTRQNKDLMNSLYDRLDNWENRKKFYTWVIRDNMGFPSIDKMEKMEEVFQEQPLIRWRFEEKYDEYLFFNYNFDYGVDRLPPIV